MYEMPIMIISNIYTNIDKFTMPPYRSSVLYVLI